MNLKFQIAKLIAGGTHYSEHADYEELIEAIYHNRYRAIDKCPTQLYFEGITESFVLKDLETANRILDVVKEVTKDILEVSGIELTFTDGNWDNIKYIENTEWNKERVPFKLLKTDKGYMSEFFEN